MAADGRIPVRHEDLFAQPVLLMSVEPVEDFELVKAAREAGQVDAVTKRPMVDVQERDRLSGMRVWAVSVMDPTARMGSRELKVKIAADVQPVPPNGVMAPVEFEGLQVIPYVDANRAIPRVAIAYRASGFRTGRQAAKSAAA